MDIEKELDQLLRSRRMGRCKKCGGNFKSNRMGRYVCEQCGNIELDDEGRVRDFLEKNGASSYAEVEANTGARREVLDKFISPNYRL